MFGRKPAPRSGRVRPDSPDPRRNSAVFSYHANRSTGQPGTGRNLEKQQEGERAGAAAKRRKQKGPWLKRGPRLVLLVVVIAYGIFNLFLSTNPKLVRLNVDERGQLFLHSEQAYYAAAKDITTSSIFNHTKLTMNTKGAAKQMIDRFPELGNVTVKLPIIGKQPVFYLEPANPAVLLAAKSGEIFVLDTAGRALTTTLKAPKVVDLNLPTVSDESGLDITLGQVALPSSSVSFVTEVVGQLKAKQITVTSLSLPVGGSELDVKVQGAVYQIKFNLQGDGRQQVGSYLAVREYLDRNHKGVGSYIDVRVDNRAYYK